MLPVFHVFAVCAFASGFALRIIDPLIVPIALQFGLTPTAATLLSTAYAIPYAVAQPFLGPIGDRFGKARCIRVCIAGLALALLLGPLAPSFDVLLASRVAAGICAGGLIPLVLADMGDAYDMRERQVMIGRMLFAIITGQMLGSTLAGFATVAHGWRSALYIAAVPAVLAALLAWLSLAARRPPPAHPGVAQPSVRVLYGRVCENPKAVWLYAAVVTEGTLIFGLFPYIGPLLVERTGSSVDAVSNQAGLLLGAFGLGGLAYAVFVRRILDGLGVRRMCIAGAVLAATGYAALALVQVWWHGALAMALAGISYYMLHNSLQTEATELAPAARGSAVALFACGLFAGQGLGPLLFGALVHGPGFAAALFGAAAGLLALGLLVVRKIIA